MLFRRLDFYSNSFSAIAILPPSIMLETFPVCFSSSNNSILSQSSLELDDENLVFEEEFFF